MKETIIRKHKLFFSWQDEKREAWLAEMSRHGLHLKEPGTLGSFLFVAGSPMEYSYGLDYNQNKPSDDYLQLIRDAGWEYLGVRSGWHYWRKEVVNGQIPELFTDAGSKIQKYQRLFAAYVTSGPAISAMYIIGLAIFKRYPGRHPLWFVILFISLFVAWILFAAINAIMIQKRINELKQKMNL
jgi:Protein of unknown function (DUF2812)